MRSRGKGLLLGRLQQSRSLQSTTPISTTTSTALFHHVFSSTPPLLYSTKNNQTEIDAETVDKLCDKLQEATEKMRQAWLNEKSTPVDYIDRSYGEKVWADYQKTNPWILKTPVVEKKIKERYHLECHVLSTDEYQHLLSFAKNRHVQPSQVEAISDSLTDLGIKVRLHSTYKLVMEDTLGKLNDALETSINRQIEKEWDLPSSSFRPGQ